MGRGYPSDFTPDLRRLKSWPSLKGSLWRQPYLIELTYAENFHLVRNSIRGQHLKILEVGCGTGFMSLELARLGHDVVGIDSNQEIIRIARRTQHSDPYQKTRASLSYETADFSDWSNKSGTYDVVLFSRVLHDMPSPAKILSKAHSLLKHGGRVVCVEYAYDRLNRRAAIWLYQVRRVLEAAGWYPPPHLPDDVETGVNQILRKNFSKRKQHINTFEEMRIPLQRLFKTEHFSWHCYYCWDVLTDMQIPDNKIEKAMARLFKRTERFLVDSEEIQSVLFHFVGTKARK